jgi:hypothetical protein
MTSLGSVAEAVVMEPNAGEAGIGGGAYGL